MLLILLCLWLWWFPSAQCTNKLEPGSIPIAVITCCNAQSLQSTITSISLAKGFLPSQLYIFQDAVGKHDDVDNVLLQLIDDGLLLENQLFYHTHGVEKLDSHVLISRHYKHVFKVFFDLPSEFEHVIVMEDDLIVSNDFLHYFAATASVLHNDSTLFAVSAWNDHGFEDMITSNDETEEAGYLGVHRADHFPGLGWLCSRKLWLELEPQWPDFVWDVWTRMDQVNLGRHTLVPEVPRTHHIGRVGTSMHLVDFDKWFKSMALYSHEDNLFLGDLSHHLTLEVYQSMLTAEIKRSKSIDNFWDIHSNDNKGNTTFNICYHPSLWRMLAQYLGLWPPVPMEGLPLRGLTFEGITRFRWKVRNMTHTVLLVPSQSESTLDLGPCLKNDHFDSDLPTPPRQTLPNDLRVRPSKQGESCAHACASRGLWCSPDVLTGGYGGYIANNSASQVHLKAIGGCPMMVEAFGSRCMGGCVAVPNEEATPADHLLPCLWHESGSTTTCLVSPRSQPDFFDCARSKPEASRLCPCTTTKTNQLH